MTILMLLRHAKAEPGGGGDDHERALTKKGEADARRLGRHLRHVGPRPDLALVSSARRTRQTFDLLNAELAGPEIEARVDAVLFNATATQMHATTLGVDADRLLVVGHNPAVAELAASLALEGDQFDLDRLRNRFPPGSLAVLSFADRNGLQAGGGRLRALILPEDLRD